ncbi:MAG: response regulator, partial [Pseudomonadota bacterium]
LRTATTVRLPLAKLDELVKLMGEVVSSHARLRQRLIDIRALERQVAETRRSGDRPTGLRQFSLALRDDVQAQELLMGELHNQALVMRMLPLAILFESAAPLVRELARSLGKTVECRILGADIELDRQMIDRLGDPIVHLLRNAVDHGIESPDARTAAGKPRHGQVQLLARQDLGWVVIEIQDDGAGLALDRIRDKAIRKGLLSPEQVAALSDSEVMELIFLPGFSTSTIITDLSGRGVGMDVVKQTVVDDLQGMIGVESRVGLGSTFSLKLPMSLAVMRVLLCEAGGLPFGFTAQSVFELIRLAPGQLMNLAERQVMILRNEFVPVVRLDALLQLPVSQDPPRPSPAGLLLVVVQVRSEKLALVVDQLLDEQDMVIKPLPEHMRQLPWVSGMVMTGRNELVSVLQVPALLEQARRTRLQGHAVVAASRHRLLVVDDSLNTREIEKEVLEAHGYQVTLAEDGLDGWQKALAGEFDAVLTDVEMPGLDGFSLTAQLRQEVRYKNIPIIIITSRETETDKRRGIQVGADAYIVKGNFDQSILVDTLNNLLG